MKLSQAQIGANLQASYEAMLGHGPLTAIEIAKRLHLEGNRETKRRLVRGLVRRLRESGHRICAEIPGGQVGYWVARDDAEWRDYLAAKETETRFRFVDRRRMATAASERATGQGKFW